MSFSWANLSLAKQALKNAQKKIDEVLDIREEGEDDDEQGTSAVVDDDSYFSAVGDNSAEIVCEQPSGPVAEVRSDAAASECDHWNRELNEGRKNEVIVDSEPNPIHDAIPHSSSALLNHSPNSTSPDEAEAEDHGRHQGHDLSDEAAAPTTSADNGEEFATVPLNDTPVDLGKTSLSRRSSRHEDQMTVASSDIEVIRNVDTWSLASGAYPGQQHGRAAMNLPEIKMSESTETLKGQLRHHEQRLEELRVINQKLQETNAQLQQRIVTLNIQEKTLRKEIAQKEQERIDILDEGKKMSDYSGKQSREIRRLKAQMADADKVKAERKKLKDEKMECEIRIDELRDELSTLNDKLSTVERELREEKNEKSASEQVTEQHKTQHAENARRIIELEEELKHLNETVEVLQQQKEVLGEKFSKMTENEFAGRIASERANDSAAAANSELMDLRRQNEHLRTQLRELQQKLEKTSEDKRGMLEMVAQTNTSLLADIEELKWKLAEERASGEELTVTKRVLERQVTELQNEVERYNALINSANERSSSEQANLLSRITKLESQQARLNELHEERLEKEREEKNSMAAALENERKVVEDVREECSAIRGVAANLEKTQSALREQLAEARERLSEQRAEQRLSPDSVVMSDGGACTARPSTQTLTFSSTCEAAAVEEEEDGAPSGALSSATPHSFSATLTHSRSAAESELQSLLRHHEQNVRRISDLEAATRRAEGDVAERDAALRELKNKYRDLDFQYNSLLELDGERLEKLEELQADVIDLRQLLKDQLMAFAEAAKRTESQRLPHEEE